MHPAAGARRTGLHRCCGRADALRSGCLAIRVGRKLSSIDVIDVLIDLFIVSLR